MSLPQVSWPRACCPHYLRPNRSPAQGLGAGGNKPVPEPGERSLRSAGECRSLDKRKARLKTCPHSGDLPKLRLVSLLHGLRVS